MNVGELARMTYIEALALPIGARVYLVREFSNHIERGTVYYRNGQGEPMIRFSDESFGLINTTNCRLYVRSIVEAELVLADRALAA